MIDLSKVYVHIAIPAYNGMMHESCFISLLKFLIEASKLGINWTLDTMGNESLITRARNNLAGKFLHNQKATHLMFIDSDIRFEPEDIMKLILADKDVCCGAYPVKKLPAQLVINELDDGEKEGDLVEVSTAGTGFMLIKREVFDTLKKDNPKLQIKLPEEKRKNINAEIMGAENTEENPSEDCLWNFFDTSFDDHLFKGEDIAFCELARKSKFKIHANIDSTTIHHGPYGYKGKFRDALEKVT